MIVRLLLLSATSAPAAAALKAGGMGMSGLKRGTIVTNYFSLRKCAALALALCLALPLAGCESKGAKATCDRLAQALEKKDGSLFLAQIDMDAYAYHELANLRKDNDLLKLADKFSNLLGIDNELNDLLLSATQLKEETTKTFSRTVANGEMMAICSRSTTADCPWEPTGLKNAKIKELGEDAAIATITTKPNITSWIALRKKGENWVVVGKAPEENTATLFATDKKGMPQKPEAMPEPVFPGQEKEPAQPSDQQAGKI